MTRLGTQSRRRYHRFVLVFVAVVAVAITPSVAVAATPEEAAAGASGGIYIEVGAEEVDEARLAELIAQGAAEGLEVTVVVLAEPTDAVAFAGAVNDLVPGTVLVFTPDAYGVASDELGQETLDDALRDAADALSSPSVADGVAAFVDAAAPSSPNWGLIIVLAVIGVAVIGVSGRLVERRATRARRAAALQKTWTQLETRADHLASPVLDLSTRVELAGEASLAEDYRIAAGLYGTVRDRLARAPSAESITRIEADLDDLERRVDHLERDLDAASG